MVRIRLRRVGARNQASFRIVAADRRSPRDGRFLAILGHYNPRTEPATISVNEAELFEWLSNGAMPSESVMQVLKLHGTWDRWERYKAGEELGTLLAEAAETAVEVDPRTRRDDRERRKPSRKSRARAQAEAQAEAEGEPEQVADTVVEPETETEPEEQEAGDAGEEAVSTAEPDAQAEAGEEVEVESEAEAEGQPESDVESGEHGEQEPEPEPEAEMQSEAVVDQDVDGGEPGGTVESEPDEVEQK